ncbi:glycosyltransferase [Dysosmobacter sp.]
MKRILIVSHAMELGGAERSLVGLLDAMDPARCQVDLFLLRREGELMRAIPDWVNVLPQIPAYTVLARPMKDTLKEGHVLLTAARLWGKWRAALCERRNGYTESGVPLEYSHKYTCPFMPEIQPQMEYDLAVSFLTPHYFVAQKVRAKKKIAWIHTDYSGVQVDAASERAMWDAYDEIVSISESVSQSFSRVFPQLGGKLVLMENILPRQLILRQSQAFDVSGEMPRDGSFRLLSVGRYCRAKNFDNVPAICAALLEKGLSVRWYLIGFGGDEALIRRQIAEQGMEKNVILLGKRDNPYPYIRACDLYVQPSRYEGNCVAVREAQLLGRPVVITKYKTSASQLEDGVDGVVVPLENAGCAGGIAALLRSPGELERLSGICRGREYSNAGEIEKLYRLIEA